jgi:hypothetical protein
MSSILVILGIIVIAVGYTGYRIVKGLIHGVKGAGRKVKVTYKNVRKA